MRGLRAVGPPPPGVAMLLRRARVVHTFGMQAPILVAFLDAHLTLRATRLVRRRRLVGPVRGTRHVLECAPDAALAVGERLQLVTAPSEAEPTRRAYFASAPEAYRGSG
jgi:hypothetical protein